MIELCGNLSGGKINFTSLSLNTREVFRICFADLQLLFRKVFPFYVQLSLNLSEKVVKREKIRVEMAYVQCRASNKIQVP